MQLMKTKLENVKGKKETAATEKERKRKWMRGERKRKWKSREGKWKWGTIWIRRNKMTT